MLLSAQSSPNTVMYLSLYAGFFLACENFGRMFDHSFPACAVFVCVCVCVCVCGFLLLLFFFFFSFFLSIVVFFFVFVF